MSCVTSGDLRAASQHDLPALIADCNEFLVDQMTSDMDPPLLPTLVTSDPRWAKAGDTRRH